MRTIKSIKVGNFYDTRFGPAKILEKKKGRITVLLCENGHQEYQGFRVTFWSHDFMEYLKNESRQAAAAR